MTTRLVGDELDLDLSALATGLVIIVVVVVGGGWARALDAAVLDRIAISDGVFIEGGGRALIVLVGDIGHGNEGMTRLTLLSCVPMTLLDMGSGGCFVCLSQKPGREKLD